MFNINLLLLIVCITLELLFTNEDSLLNQRIGFIEGSLGALIIFTSPYYTLGYIERGLKRSLPFLIAAIVVFILHIIFRVILGFKSFYYILIGAMVISVLYSFYIGSKSRKKSRRPLKNYLIYWFIVFVLFILMVVFDLVDFFFKSYDELASDFHYLPVLYILMALFQFKQLRNRVRDERVTMEEIIKKYDITPREGEVVKLISMGLVNKTIAEELCISTSTVKNHISNILKKTNLTSRYELIGLLKNSN